MKAYLSYSSKSYKKGIDQNTINLHKICFYHLRRHFKEVNFITDSYSKNFFSDIPWTNICTELDSLPEEYRLVWSLSKIKAYEIIAKKGEPFIHVDSDVFLWQPLKKVLLESGVFVQCPENIIDHGYEIKKFIKNCPDKSIFHHIQYPMESYNMGIFGGTDLNFILEYSQRAQDFIFSKKNQSFWLEFNEYENSWSKAVLAEQYFLKGFSVYKDKKIECLFPKWPSEEEAASIGYTHLMLAKSLFNIQTKLGSLAEEYSKSFTSL